MAIEWPGQRNPLRAPKRSWQLLRQSPNFSVHVACVVDRKFRVNDVGKLPCSCRGWTAARLWYMAMQPAKVLGGRLLKEDNGITIGACRRMVCRRIATSVWNPRNRKTFTSGKKKKVAVECKQSYYLNTMSCQENQGSVTTTLLIYIPY